jgi:DNA-nicking Smr family endonuclease
MLRQDPFYINLHGYREEEIDSLLDAITAIRARRMGVRQVVCLTAMTGKGIHSKNSRSVLKPASMDWCDSRRFDFEEE